MSYLKTVLTSDLNIGSVLALQGMINSDAFNKMLMIKAYPTNARYSNDGLRNIFSLPPFWFCSVTVWVARKRAGFQQLGFL